MDVIGSLRRPPIELASPIDLGVVARPLIDREER